MVVLHPSGPRTHYPAQGGTQILQNDYALRALVFGFLVSQKPFSAIATIAQVMSLIASTAFLGGGYKGCTRNDKHTQNLALIY